MELMSIGIGALLIAIITFIAKNWTDIIAVKDLVKDLINEIEKAKSDGNLTDKEKDAILEHVQKVLDKVIPLFASVWKKNWGSKKAKKLVSKE